MSSVRHILYSPTTLRRKTGQYSLNDISIITNAPVMKVFDDFRHLVHQKHPIGVHRIPGQNSDSFCRNPLFDIRKNFSSYKLYCVWWFKTRFGEAWLDRCELPWSKGWKWSEKIRTRPCCSVHQSSILCHFSITRCTISEDATNPSRYFFSVLITYSIPSSIKSKLPLVISTYGGK